jgi:hypothetical protein
LLSRILYGLWRKDRVDKAIVLIKQALPKRLGPFH